MANINNIEKRLTKLENRFEKLVVDSNHLHDGVARYVQKLEKRITRIVKDQNKVNLKDYKNIVALEKRFTKLEKYARKMKKHTDPRQMERNTLKLVDQALKAYDQKKGKR